MFSSSSLFNLHINKYFLLFQGNCGLIALVCLICPLFFITFQPKYDEKCNNFLPCQFNETKFINVSFFTNITTNTTTTTSTIDAKKMSMYYSKFVTDNIANVERFNRHANNQNLLNLFFVEIINDKFAIYNDRRRKLNEECIIKIIYFVKMAHLSFAKVRAEIATHHHHNLNLKFDVCKEQFIVDKTIKHVLYLQLLCLPLLIGILNIFDNYNFLLNHFHILFSNYTLIVLFLPFSLILYFPFILINISFGSFFFFYLYLQMVICAILPIATEKYSKLMFTFQFIVPLYFQSLFGHRYFSILFPSSFFNEFAVKFLTQNYRDTYLLVLGCCFQFLWIFVLFMLSVRRLTTFKFTNLQNYPFWMKDEILENYYQVIFNTSIERQNPQPEHSWERKLYLISKIFPISIFPIYLALPTNISLNTLNLMKNVIDYNSVEIHTNNHGLLYLLQNHKYDCVYVCVYYENCKSIIKKSDLNVALPFIEYEYKRSRNRIVYKFTSFTLNDLKFLIEQFNLTNYKITNFTISHSVPPAFVVEKIMHKYLTFIDKCNFTTLGMMLSRLLSHIKNVKVIFDLFIVIVPLCTLEYFWRRRNVNFSLEHLIDEYKVEYKNYDYINMSSNNSGDDGGGENNHTINCDYLFRILIPFLLIIFNVIKLRLLYLDYGFVNCRKIKVAKMKLIYTIVNFVFDFTFLYLIYFLSRILLFWFVPFNDKLYENLNTTLYIVSLFLENQLVIRVLENGHFSFYVIFSFSINIFLTFLLIVLNVKNNILSFILIDYRFALCLKSSLLIGVDGGDGDVLHEQYKIIYYYMYDILLYTIILVCLMVFGGGNRENGKKSVHNLLFSPRDLFEIEFLRFGWRRYRKLKRYIHNSFTPDDKLMENNIYYILLFDLYKSPDDVMEVIFEKFGKFDYNLNMFMFNVLHKRNKTYPEMKLKKVYYRTGGDCDDDGYKVLELNLEETKENVEKIGKIAKEIGNVFVGTL